MVDGEQGMPFKHSGTGVTHHFGYVFTHVGIVTVNFTLRTRALVLAKWTLVQPLSGILKEVIAIGTQEFTNSSMMGPAENSYHCRNRRFLSFEFLHGLLILFVLACFL